MSNVTENALLAKKIYQLVKKRCPNLSNLVWNDIHDALEESRPTMREIDLAYRDLSGCEAADILGYDGDHVW